MPLVTHQHNFSAARGHVVDGTVIIMRNGEILTLENTPFGWQLSDEEGRPFGYPTTSVHVIECLVYVHPSEEI